MPVDHVVVGSGISGAAIARTLHDAGRSVLVVERRSAVGGNVRDETHPSGIRFHVHGPHYFRTNSSTLWSFVRRFADFYKFEAVLASWVDDRYEAWPVTADYIARTVGVGWQPSTAAGRAENFEQACLAMMPEQVYLKFVKGYTEKQWGVAATELAPALAGRFDVRPGHDLRLKTHRYQGLPVGGYSAWMESMLSGIPVVTDCDYLSTPGDFPFARSLVFTGPIDEYFGYSLGHLRYRGQQRRHIYRDDIDQFQPYIQVNNPGAGPHIRTLEWKHLVPADGRSPVSGTLLTEEVPYSPDRADDFEYPFPDDDNVRLYAAYRKLASTEPRVTICGRLGEYRYLDMDHALARALRWAKKLLR
ncbi:MAG TPA: UDP-galactopyranose mutase [Acidimicrobiales bacterium]|nr:UDP-galactopyranose mutase [Acidimicrobiales bacterium]